MSLSDLAGRLLPELDAALPQNVVVVLQSFLAEHGGAADTRLLLADYEGNQLLQLQLPTSTTPLQAVPVDGTPAGRCFLSQTTITRPTGDAVEVSVPVSMRGERLGVMQVDLVGPLDAELLRGLEQVATTVAYIVVAAGRCSDIFEQARRAVPLAIAAEMQWNLQPLRAFTSDSFALAGQLAPAYEVGGDCYDYSVAAQYLDLSVLDAMGHGVQASLLAALATAVLRNVRRAGGDPVAQVTAAAAQLAEQFHGDGFATCAALRLDLQSGALSVVTAGHPPGWLVRHGRAQQLELDPQLPLGLLEGTVYSAEQVQLQPGDRLVLVSDGVLEAGAPGEEFGEQRLEGLLTALADRPQHDTVREALQAVRGFAGDRLQDDATVLCVDWYGSDGEEKGPQLAPAATTHR